MARKRSRPATLARPQDAADPISRGVLDAPSATGRLPLHQVLGLITGDARVLPLPQPEPKALPPQPRLKGHAAVAATVRPRLDPYTAEEFKALIGDARSGDDQAKRQLDRLIADPHFNPNKLPSRVNGRLQRPDPPAWHGPLPFARTALGGLRHIDRGPTEADWAQMRADYQAGRRARMEPNPQQHRNHFTEE